MVIGDVLGWWARRVGRTSMIRRSHGPSGTPVGPRERSGRPCDDSHGAPYAPGVNGLFDTLRGHRVLAWLAVVLDGRRHRHRRLHRPGLAVGRCRVHDRDHADDGRLQGGSRARRPGPRLDDARGGRRRRDHLRHGRHRRRVRAHRRREWSKGGEADERAGGPAAWPHRAVRLRPGRIHRRSRTGARGPALRRHRHQPGIPGRCDGRRPPRRRWRRHQ